MRAGSLRGPRRCVSPAGLGSPAEAGPEAGRPRRRLPIAMGTTRPQGGRIRAGPGRMGPPAQEHPAYWPKIVLVAHRLGPSPPTTVSCTMCSFGRRAVPVHDPGARRKVAPVRCGSRGRPARRARRSRGSTLTRFPVAVVSHRRPAITAASWPRSRADLLIRLNPAVHAPESDGRWGARRPRRTAAAASRSTESAAGPMAGGEHGRRRSAAQTGRGRRRSPGSPRTRACVRQPGLAHGGAVNVAPPTRFPYPCNLPYNGPSLVRYPLLRLLVALAHLLLLNPCRNNECVRRFTVFAFNQRS